MSGSRINRFGKSIEKYDIKRAEVYLQRMNFYRNDNKINKTIIEKFFDSYKDFGYILRTTDFWNTNLSRKDSEKVLLWFLKKFEPQFWRSNLEYYNLLLISYPYNCVIDYFLSDKKEKVLHNERGQDYIGEFLNYNKSAFKYYFKIHPDPLNAILDYKDFKGTLKEYLYSEVYQNQRFNYLSDEEINKILFLKECYVCES